MESDRVYTKFSKWVFLGAGIYGLLTVLPLFNESGTAQLFPPTVNHPEYYYGFIGTVIAWQVAFIIISRDPIKHRPLILPAILEKMIYAVSIFILAGQGRVVNTLLGFAFIDLILGGLFIVSYVLTAAAGKNQG
jgi:hypothetical protein